MLDFFTPEIQSKILVTAEAFVTLFVELTFLFIAISYLVAIINQKIPAEKIQQLLGTRKGRGYFISAGLGAITPFCSCSTIPMLVGLLKARAGFGPVMTFLFTSPLLNPIVIVLFIPVLGIRVTIIYAVLALSISIISGMLLQYFNFEKYIKRELIEPVSCCSGPAPVSTSCCDSSESKSDCCGESKSQEVMPSSHKQAWQESYSLFKTMMPYMFISMIIGAIVHGFVPADFFTEVAGKDNPAAIPVAALIGIPLYIRVTALIPLIGSFVAKGMSIGAVMALVIGSGGASLPEMILLKKLFKWPLLLAFLSVIFTMAIVGGFVFNVLIG